MRVSKEIREKAVDYGFESIKYICEEIGPRESGMPNERKAQEWLKDQLLTNGWADEAVIEDFTVSRHGLVGFTKIVSVLLVLAAAIQFVGYFVTAAAMWCHIVTIVLAALSFTITVLEFLMYKPFIDPFLPKTTSGNVYARYKSAGETKRRIIFSGHCDSAYEWTLMKIKPAFMITVIVMCVVGVLASVALCIYGAVKGATPVWSLVVTMVFVPFYVLLYFFCTFKVVVPGANDNLTGVLASVGVLKCLKESGIRFENTEVDVVLTGSEEAGLRGAFAWAKNTVTKSLQATSKPCLSGLKRSATGIISTSTTATSRAQSPTTQARLNCSTKPRLLAADRSNTSQCSSERPTPPQSPRAGFAQPALRVWTPLPQTIITT